MRGLIIRILQYLLAEILKNRDIPMFGGQNQDCPDKIRMVGRYVTNGDIF